MQLDLELVGALDADRLKAAVQALVERHASLRACFRHEGLSRPGAGDRAAGVGAVAADRSVGADAADSERELAALLRAGPAERFDLGAPPLLRFALIRLAADRHRLVLSSNHHLLMDGWSAPVLVRELLAALCGSAAARRRCRARRRIAIIWRSSPAGPGGGAAAWRDALAGLREGTRLAPRRRGANAAVAPEQIVLSLTRR